MTRQMNIAGSNSNEIYTLFYPSNLMNFCRYDFSLFMEHCTDLCRLAARTGEYNIDDVYAIRNSISGCHKYYEQNMRTTFEKIVVDCWIDYLCKQSEISVNTLWQSFMKCRNAFEKAIFGRLSDYRYNRAINEWTNLLKMQDYARTKVDFVFGVQIRSPQQAVARANYFDLLFNVAANEQGFPVAEIASTGIYSAGRLPNSPFVMNTAAREIARNQLKDIEYREGYRSRKNPDLTDKTAMDAFTAIKNYIPDKNDSMAKTIIKSLTATPQIVYLPGSFKAIIDLEIDASAQSGAYIQKCVRCGDYYIRDEEYDFDYCSRLQREGGTCLELMKIDDPELAVAAAIALPSEQEDDRHHDEEPNIVYVDKDTVTAKMDQLYKEMAARVNVDLTQRDFSRWYQRELRLKDDILLGEAGEKELNEFIELSRGDEFASKKQAPVFEPPEKNEEEEEEEAEEYTENGKPVRKFVFEKVDRETTTSPISSSPSTLAESEKATMDAVRKLLGSDRARSHVAKAGTAANAYAYNGAPQYDPAGQQAYGYPAHGMPTAQQVPQQSSTGYGGNPGFGSGQYGQFYQSFRPQATSRIIKGGSAPAQQQPEQSVVKPKTVVIPNGSEPRPDSRQELLDRIHERAAERGDSKVIRTDKAVPFAGRAHEEAPDTRIDSPKSSVFKAYGKNLPEPENEEENDDDIKVFTPRRNNIFRTKQSDDYIEPSPYEKLRQAIEDREDKEPAPKDEEVAGQISAEEFTPAAPTRLTASAISAYKGYSPAGGSGGESDEKDGFAHILDGMTRDDGFSKDDEGVVDSDGLPVSHKTKHLMNAVFGPSKASPILRVNLDDDDE